MSKPRLRTGESVVCAFAERAAGPGFANSPIWVVIQSNNGVLRKECLQPNDQSNEMLVLYNISAEVHGLMQALARTAMKPGKAK